MVALKALRNVIETQLEGPHLKMIMDIQATEKSDLGFWSKTVSCELAECIWDFLDKFYIVVHGQPHASSPCKPSQLSEKDEEEDMDDNGLIQCTKEEQQAKQARINLHRQAAMEKDQMTKDQNTQYSAYKKSQFAANNIPGKNKYLGVTNANKKFNLVRVYVQYLKTAPKDKDNQCMVDHLKATVPPMWKLWPSRPHENFDGKSVTKERYDVFFGYMRNL